MHRYLCLYAQTITGQDHLETGLNRVIKVLREEDRSIEAMKDAIKAFNETLIDIGRNIRHKNAEVDLLATFAILHNKIEAENCLPIISGQSPLHILQLNTTAQQKHHPVPCHLESIVGMRLGHQRPSRIITNSPLHLGPQEPRNSKGAHCP
jgi:hypothetical protein